MNMDRTEESTREQKEYTLKTLLEKYPDGIALIDAKNETGMTYETIERIANSLGYEVVKERIVRLRPVLVIKKKNAE